MEQFDAKQFRLDVSIAVGNLHSRLARHPETETLQGADEKVLEWFHAMHAWHVNNHKHQLKTAAFPLERARDMVREILASIDDVLADGHGARLAIHRTLARAINERWTDE